MGCKKGKKSKTAKPGRFQCDECGVVTKKKNVCSPAKIKKKIKK